jgi:opacity protein-like surface antigen
MKGLEFLVPIFLLLGLYSGSIAQTDLGPKGMGGFLGYVDPEHVGGTLGLGVIVDMGTLTPKLGLDLEMLYWSKSKGPSGRELRWRDFTLAAHTKYRFSLPGSGVEPYLGGGIGPHFVKSEHEQTNTSGSDTKFGLHLLAGAEYPASLRVTVFGEWRYAIVSDLNQFAIFVGARYELGE